MERAESPTVALRTGSNRMSLKQMEALGRRPSMMRRRSSNISRSEEARNRNRVYDVRNIEDFIQEISDNTITTINLRGRIDHDDIERVAQALSQNTSVNSLDISRNRFGDEGVIRLLMMLFKGDGGGIRILNLANNQIGEVGMKAIAEFLRDDSTLEVLFLMDNDCGDIGSMHLAEALKTNHTLRTLNLERNDIFDDGAAALRTTIEMGGCTNLQELHLGGNSISLPVQDDIEKLLSEKSDVLRQTEPLMNELAKEYLTGFPDESSGGWREGFYGQHLALNEVATVMAALKWRPNRDTNTPYRLLFVGERGCGKHELAKRLARGLHTKKNDDQSMDDLERAGKYIELQMDKYAKKQERALDLLVAKLPITVGQQIGPVVFIDGIDIASDYFYSTLFYAFDKGVLKHGGASVGCQNAVFIMTGLVGENSVTKVFRLRQNSLQRIDNLEELDKFIVDRGSNKSIVELLKEEWNAALIAKSTSRNRQAGYDLIAYCNKVIPFLPLTEEDMAERAKHILINLKRKWWKRGVMFGWTNDVQVQIGDGFTKLGEVNSRVTALEDFLERSFGTGFDPQDCVLLYCKNGNMSFVKRSMRGRQGGQPPILKRSGSLTGMSIDVRKANASSAESVLSSWQKYTEEGKKGGIQTKSMKQSLAKKLLAKAADMKQSPPAAPTPTQVQSEGADPRGAGHQAPKPNVPLPSPRHSRKTSQNTAESGEYSAAPPNFTKQRSGSLDGSPRSTLNTAENSPVLSAAPALQPDAKVKSMRMGGRPMNLKQWDVHDVMSWLEDLGLGKHASKFEEKGITGLALTVIDKDTLVIDLGLQLGPALEVMARVRAMNAVRAGWQLRANSRDLYIIALSFVVIILAMHCFLI